MFFLNKKISFIALGGCHNLFARPYKSFLLLFFKKEGLASCFF